MTQWFANPKLSLKYLTYAFAEVSPFIYMHFIGHQEKNFDFRIEVLSRMSEDKDKNSSSGSPRSHDSKGHNLLVPSPLPTRRTRTVSM